jgi:hypothetical protein
MPEKYTDCEMVFVEYQCDICSEGVCQLTNKPVFLSNPPMYIHQCNICQHEIGLTSHYPLTRAIKIESPKTLIQ